MDNKIIRIMKKMWIILVSLLLLFPMTIIWALIGTIFIEITGCEWLYYFALVIAGILSSLPITYKVWKTDKIRKSIKIVIIVLLILLFSMVSYALIWYE